MIILDTNHISALQYRETPKAFALQARLETFSPDEVATTAITIEEQTRGWLGLIRRYPDVHRQVVYYERLVRLFDFFAEWQGLPFNQRAADEFRANFKWVCPGSHAAHASTSSARAGFS